MNEYKDAKDRGFTNTDRREKDRPHHPKSEKLFRFLADHDHKDYGDSFGWKAGGDGDNGETLMYQLDAFFEYKDALAKQYD